MGSRNVWILLIVVLLLGGVVLWQLDREKGPEFQADQPLFDGVRPERVQRVRIDNLERGLQLTLERDENGVFQIVDPMHFPAEPGVLERLFEAISQNRASVVDRPDLKAFELDPPRVVLEVSENLPTGERTQRLELGAVLPDGKHVFARIDGRVVRTLLNLDSTLERDLAGWRQRRILNIDPASVVELRRSGDVVLDPEYGSIDMLLEAGTTEHGWRSTRPWNAALDPSAIQALLTNVCYLDARNFVADSLVQIAPFGMDSPELRVELGIVGGVEAVLLFRRNPQTEGWLCMREGSTHLFRVDHISVLNLVWPSEGYLDARIARFERADVQRIELERGTERLELRRDGLIWRLSTGLGAWIADTQAVGDLMGAVEHAKVVRFLIDGEVSGFTPADPPLAIRFATKDAQFGAQFGAPHEAAPGVLGRLFQRPGDDLVGVVEESLAQVASRPMGDFVDRQMIKLPEQGISRIEVRRGEFQRVFVRDGKTGRWSVQGLDGEAPKPFLKSLERLISLRADRAVAPGESFELADPWLVEVVDGGEVHVRYRLGPLASDPAQIGFDDGHRRGVVTSTGLFQDLALIP